MSLLNDVLKDLDHRKGQDPDVALIQQSSIGAQFAANDKRKKIIGASVAGGLILIGTVAFFFMRGGGEGGSKPTVVQPSVPVAANPASPAPPTMPAAELDPDAVYEVPATARASVGAEPAAQPEPEKASQPEKSAPAPAAPARVIPKFAAAEAPAPAAVVPRVARSEVAAKPAPKPKAVAVAPQPRIAPKPASEPRRISAPELPSSPATSRYSAPSASSYSRSATPAPAPAPRRAPRSIQRLYELDLAARAEAEKLIKLGETQQAELILRQFLNEQPTAQLSRGALAGLLLQMNRASEAEQVLMGGMAHQPEGRDTIKLLARTYMGRDDAEGALRLLDANAVPLSEDPEYHSLRAALYQRTGQHERAVQTYRSLLAEYPPQGAWWVGLAISLESSGQRREAISAYRQARDDHGGKPALKSFAAQRIAALTR